MSLVEVTLNCTREGCSQVMSSEQCGTVVRIGYRLTDEEVNTESINIFVTVFQAMYK